MPVPSNKPLPENPLLDNPERDRVFKFEDDKTVNYTIRGLPEFNATIYKCNVDCFNVSIKEFTGQAFETYKSKEEATKFVNNFIDKRLTVAKERGEFEDSEDNNYYVKYKDIDYIDTLYCNINDLHEIPGISDPRLDKVIEDVDKLSSKLDEVLDILKKHFK